MKRYANYIFDLYGTLIDIHCNEDSPALWRKMAGLYAQNGAVWEPRGLRAAYRRMVREEEEALVRRTGCVRPEIRLEAVFRRLLEEAPVHADTGAAGEPDSLALQLASAFRVLSRTKLCLFPGVADTLAALRASGAGVYLLSNAQRCFTWPEIVLTGLDGAFDAAYLSSDCGVGKPDPAFMGRLLRERRLNPADCVMVGNDPEDDMRTAAEAGMDGVLLNTWNLTEADFLARAARYPRVTPVMGGRITVLTE